MPRKRDEGMQERLERIETKLDGLAASLVAFESRLSTKVDVQMENMRDVIQKFAEGLGGRLDAISQQLAESNQKWDAQFSDHDLALRDHARRITSLEQSRS